MFSWINYLIRIWAFRSRLRFNGALRTVSSSQSDLLNKIVKDNNETVFGHAHDFVNIKSIDDYRARVPITDYSYYESYIDKILAGDGNQLTKEQPFMFNITSGTTSKSKLIPVTKDMLRLNKQLQLIWLAALVKDHPLAFSNKILALTSPFIEKEINAIPCGNMSGAMYKHPPSFIAKHYVIPESMMTIDDYDLRYYLIVRIAIEQDLSLIATANPTTLLVLADVLQKHAETYINATRTGEIGIDVSGIDEKIISEINKSIKPNEQLSKRLQNIVDKTSKLIPEAVWPQLSLICCWLGGNVGIHANALHTLYGEHIAIRDIGYLASEGYMSIPLSDHSADGLLALPTNFYEFVPVELKPQDNPPTLLAHELEVGKHYYIIITNNAGLYRYNLNDIIRVSGYVNQCPIIAFEQKGADITNITGEKLHVSQCIAAMQELSTLFEADSFKQFRLWPNYDLLRYEIAVELSDYADITDSFWQVFIMKFDELLQQHNSEYQNKRLSCRLNMPSIILMQAGWFESQKKSATRQRGNDFQFKWTNLMKEVSQDDKPFIIRMITMEDENESE